jgi:hypothetical protein
MNYLIYFQRNHFSLHVTWLIKGSNKVKPSTIGWKLNLVRKAKGNLTILLEVDDIGKIANEIWHKSANREFYSRD